ncbi:hypothetical protein PRZ48_004314 [Zasmidium cellare]|uniref:Uncharacterized protein n=1 Tax=Zasmidium cellare TaxID=395010 RepID=A0ABR0EPU8_ZASCE|nr:hypothetical protein PRZ48_004314 [Zasmidium cellare]
MANQVPKNSVWSAMEYQPPRGRCNYKTSILSSCPCLRFMLHPVKAGFLRAATSFDCDGCGHHASFHSLENEDEDKVLKKWAENESNNQSQATGGSNRKRRRIAEESNHEIEVLELIEDDTEPAWVSSSSRPRSQKQTRKTTKGSSTRGS